MTNEVFLFHITQATTATFTDLYIRLTCLFFIQRGSKRVLTPGGGEVIGEEGDVLVFSPGAIVTMENRPVMDQHYRAVGVSFTDDLVRDVFPEERAPTRMNVTNNGAIAVIRAEPSGPRELLENLQESFERTDLPDPIRRHRLIEPLVWLRYRGHWLTANMDETPFGKVRRIVQTDLSRDWRAGEIADALAMSEATMRRVLARSGHGFAKILLNTRLEHGLGLLQTTELPISTIALTCGFKTPAHFSDAFKRRFSVRPKEIRAAET